MKYLILILCCWFLNWLSGYLITTDEIIYTSLEERLSSTQILNLIDQRERWNWLSYVLIPIFYSVKVSLTTLCVTSGLLMANIKVRFGTVFSIGVTAEFIFLIELLLMIIWFALVQKNYSISDIQNFAPLSLLNLFDETSLEAWERYPLMVANAFELAYIFILTGGISKEYNQSFDRSLRVVLASYGTGLAIWVLAITYLLVTFS